MVQIAAPKEPLNVGILGCTGVVGQRLCSLLATHPWFKVKALAASEKSAGKRYADVVRWTLDEPIPKAVRDMVILTCDVPQIKETCDLVFSGLDASVAGDIETAMATAGLPVFSNSKNHRNDPYVPILLPYVSHGTRYSDWLGQINADQRDAILCQETYQQSGGFIVNNANCAATGVCIILQPLMKLYGGIGKAFIMTMQAVSGAGFPGVPSLAIMDSVVPFIKDEEEKLSSEPQKIMGSFNKKDGFVFNPIEISCSCNRVPVSDGHTAVVSILFNNAPKNLSKEQMSEAVKAALIEADYDIVKSLRDLPSVPSHAINVCMEVDRPQPKLDRFLGKGMTVSVGRIRPCSLFHVKFLVVAHNGIIGAAGGSLINAEIYVGGGYLKKTQK